MIEPQVCFRSKARPVKISSGGNFTLLLLEDGSLYMAGKLPLVVDSESVALDPVNQFWIQVPGQFTDVACGWAHVAAITQSGVVVTGGIGEKGELGQSQTKCSTELRPIRVLENRQGAQVFACFYNTYVLDNDVLYGCGSNNKSQLKDPKSRVIETLERVSDDPVTRVCAGKNFVCYEDACSRLHARGPMVQYESQLQEHADQNSSFELKAMWTSVTSFSGQMFHFYAPANQKQDAIVNYRFPKPVTAWNTGSEHGIACVDGKMVFCWGWGEHGNCGRIATSRVANGVNDMSNINSDVNLAYDASSRPNATVYACFGGCATSWVCIAHKDFQEDV
ncbi:LAME_0B02124g1_1 [Lachancea meyersii CBS 8951]|uniref:LAME_0B02124g1_1 n=1 Tax=Lachancea meyersii CBS 8951 TaxID=1266667 RepID=A0A1G4ITE5_9SACH|nr:LAME_0B02124g1_1 [Lachancea meyersii CBS 8951]